MKNNDYYKKANDTIISTEQLKRKTKNKILEKQNRPKRVVLKLVNVAVVFIFVLSILWLADENKYKQKNNLAKITIPNQETTDKLKKVDNIENLKKLIKQTQETKENSLYEDSSIEMDSNNKTESAVIEDTTQNETYSRTNKQVENVDEADIVKTDGQYIYYVGNNNVYIIEANTLKVSYEIKYSDEEFNPRELFLKDNRLVVIGSQNQVVQRYIDSVISQGAKTVVMLYDITDKSNVIKIREISIEGSFLTARMVEDNLYLLTNQYIYIPYDTNIENIPQTDLVPCYKDSIISEEEKDIELTDIAYFPGQIDSNSYLILAGLNIKNQEEVKLETILGGGNNVYCSEQNIYIAKTKYNYNLIDEAKSAIGMGNNYTVHTEIYKFALNNGDITYKSNGNVPGYSINQFSMDEYEGNFRIATTKQTSWNTDKSTNNLYILDNNLNTIGKLENLAKGEKIYSVRFMGEKAYIVTFKQTDPLFVIDLSTPIAPVVLGELKIPGYSTYLHPYDETHLIGFGYNTETVNDAYGETVKNTGMKMALFDVTDVENPKELFKVDIGTEGTYSELLYNHKALLFSKEKNIIAFPITISEGTSNRYNLKFQGAIVYGLDLENGFVERAKIANKEASRGTMDYDYNYATERIIYIGDNLYTVSKSLVKQINMNTMKITAQVEI